MKKYGPFRTSEPDVWFRIAVQRCPSCEVGFIQRDIRTRSHYVTMPDGSLGIATTGKTTLDVCTHCMFRKKWITEEEAKCQSLA